MAKVNKALAAKKARQGSMYYGGTVGIGARDYVSHYSQGVQAYLNGERMSSAWHRHKIQGYKKAFAEDEKFLAQMKEKAKAMDKNGDKFEPAKPWVLERILNRMAVQYQQAA